MYPDLAFGVADVERFLAVCALAERSEESGADIVVDRLQELLHDIVGVVMAAAQESSAAALVAVTSLVSRASTVEDADIPMVDVFADEDIWAVLDS